MAEEKIRKIATTGAYDTYFITLPKEMIRELRWKKGEKKVIKKDSKRIIIEDWVKESGRS